MKAVMSKRFRKLAKDRELAHKIVLSKRDESFIHKGKKYTVNKANEYNPD